jgi:DNA-binding beta-propeller fold protein YncE
MSRNWRSPAARAALVCSLAWAASASFCESEQGQLTPIRDNTPPTASVLDVLSSTDSVTVRARATDNVALRSLRVEVATLGQAGDTVVLASRTFNFTGQVKDTTLTAGFGGLALALGAPVLARVTATDAAQNTAVATLATLVGLRAVDLLEPADSASLPVGDSVLTSTLLADPAGIVSLTLVGRALRGDPDFGTDTSVVRYGPKTVTWNPPLTDTIIRRWLRPTDDRTAERVYFVAIAENASGRILADSNVTFVGGPLVEILSPAAGQQVLAGTALDVRIRVRDSERIVSVGLNGSGAFGFDTTVAFLGAVLDTTITITRAIPAGALGDLTLVARATNANAVPGRSGSVTVRIVNAAPTDTVRPVVRFAFDAVPRLEVDDSIHVVVEAEDIQSGIRAVGVSAFSDNAGVRDSATFRVEFATTRTGTVIQDFYFLPFNFDATNLPDTVVYELHAFAYDAASPRNCGAAAAAGTAQSLACDSVNLGVQIVFARATRGTAYTPMIVSGRTIRSPRQGSVTPDLVVDTTRRLLFVSNQSFNQVEAYDLAARTFLAPIAVGSKPWGMVIDNSGDTLVVANSGGTNLSLVDLNTRREVTSQRIFTPNVSIFEAKEEQTETGSAIGVTVFDYSDRPQFVAQAANVGGSRGVLLYSTVPTPSAPDGTIREFDPQTRDVRFFVDYASVLPDVDQKRIQIVNADDVFSTGAQLFVCDHDRGSTTTTCFAVDTVAEALDSLANRPLWDTEIFFNLDIASIGLQDTTFVAASGDRQFIAFGEGDTGNRPGRIMMYRAVDSTISSVVQVRDLVGNASEPVRGLALNRDGSLGVARGNLAYFFDTGLRLQGISDAVSAAGTGAAFHPDYANARTANDAQQLAFLGSEDGRIDIVDAFHFCRRGTLFIRDPISGPVRTSRPLPGDPAGVLVKVFAKTTAGVVVVDVRGTDVSASCQP